MAAITYWVETATGSDANDGLTYANAKQTLSGVSSAMVAAGNGNDYTVNLVDIVLYGEGNPTIGYVNVDNQTTSTFLFRGTDSAGDPAWASISAKSNVNSLNESPLYIRENSGLTFEYLKWDLTATSGSTSTLALMQSRDSNQALPMRVRYCQILSHELADNIGHTNATYWIYPTAGWNQPVHFQYMYCRNSGPIWPGGQVAPNIITFCDSVWIEFADQTAFSKNTAALANDLTYTGLTCVLHDIDQNSAGYFASPIGPDITTYQGNAGAMDMHSNVFWIDSYYAFGALPPANYQMHGGTATPPTANKAFINGAIGNNVHITGPQLGVNHPEWLTYQWMMYSATTPAAVLKPDGNYIYESDFLARGLASGTVFEDVTSTYDWTPPGSVLAITLDMDLRLRTFLDTGSGGTIPGALGSGTTTDVGTLQINLISGSSSAITWEITGATITTVTGVGPIAATITGLSAPTNITLNITPPLANAILTGTAAAVTAYTINPGEHIDSEFYGAGFVSPAVIWVDGVNGNDSNAGGTYAQAVKTMSQAATLVDSVGNLGDFEIKVVNSAAYTMGTLASVTCGSGFDNGTILIQGVDPAGDPALVRVSGESTNIGTQYFFNPKDFTGTTIEYFLWDASVTIQAATSYLIYTDGTGGGQDPAGLPIVQYCHFCGGTFGTGVKAPTGTYRPIGTGSSNKHGKVRYCVYENQPTNVSLAASASYDFAWHNNVFVNDAINVKPTISMTFSDVAARFEFYSNTIYNDQSRSTTVTNIVSYFSSTIGAEIMEIVSNHDNVIWHDVNSFGPPAASQIVFPGAGSTNGSPMFTGHNVFYYGETVSTKAAITASPIYDTDAPWQFDQIILSGYETDKVYTGATSGATFADVEARYDWTPSGSSISFNIPDLRLVADRDVGSGGTVPGAIIDETVTTGTVSVAPSVESAGWSITGDASYNGSGTSAFTADAGSYTLTWGTVAGYREPNPAFSAGTLVASTTLEFAGTYIDTGTTLIVSPSDNSAGWTISGAVTDSGTGSGTTTDQPTGSTTITWNPVAGLSTPASETTASTDASQIEFIGTYIDTGVTITVTPSSGSSQWNLSGAVTYAGTGTEILLEQASGSTTITWQPLAGFGTPASQTTASTDGSSVEFIGTYTDTGTTIVITPSIPTATWSIAGALSYTGTGTTTLYEQATGSTTITWDSITNWTTPVPETTASTDASQIEFIGTYVFTPTATTLTAYLSGWTVTSPSGGIDDTFDPTNISNYFNYEFVVWSGTVVNSTHRILGVTATSTYVTFELSGNVTYTSNNSFALSPTRSAKENFFNGKSYERNIIEGYPGRTNTWPTHAAVTDMLLFDGSSYDTFLAAELAVALSADTVGTSPQTNVMWNKLTPEGMKHLDNDDDILQKFVLTLGMSFDKIKNYQDQMAFAHTIGYQDYDHVPRTLVRELAKLWGWSLSHDSKNSDLTTYRLGIYDHYATGTTDAVGNLSPEDINFERWRRIVSNLVRIYKAKGTRKAMELVLDVYGIPSNLLVLKEYVYFSDPNLSSWLYLREIPTGVFVITGNTSTREWMNRDSGAITVITDFPIYNARFLDIGLSETEAIVADVYSWAASTDQSLIDINGASIELSAYTGNKYDFENWMIQHFIPSDGSHRTATNYPKLEAVYTNYLQKSTNAYEFGNFEPFISFIEENFMDICRQLLPASSRLLAQGTIFENLPWHRAKHVYQPEGNVDQPFNSEKIFNIATLSGTEQTKVSATTTAIATSGAAQTQHSASTSINATTVTYPTQKSATTTAVVITATKPLQYSSTTETVSVSPSYIEQPQDTYTFSEVSSGAVFQIDTPIIGPSGTTDSGSVIFTAFNSSALIVTNDNKFDLYLSAVNMSQSGMNRVVIELFRKLNETEIDNIRSSAFTVIQTVYEGHDFNPASNNVGTYKLNSVQGLAIGDVMSATSDFDLYINQTVKILNIYTGTNQVITTPPIGVDNLPIGKNAARVAIRTLFNSAVVSHLIRAIEEEQIDYNVIMEVVAYLYSELPPIETRTLVDLAAFSKFVQTLIPRSYEIPTGDSADVQSLQFISEPIPLNITSPTLFGVFSPFYKFTTSELAGCAIAVPFLRDNKNFTLSSDRVFIPSAIINNISQVRLQKINDLFDWASPVQQKIIHQDNQDSWFGFPTEVGLGVTSTNDRVISGNTEIGGLDALNANILQDKQEYFLRYKADAEVPQEYTGETYFQIFSGYPVASSNWQTQNINNIYYFGNYFVYMRTSKEPLLDTVPTASGATDTASVEIQFKGVGDSDRLEVEFHDSGPSPDPSTPTAGPSQNVGDPGSGTTTDAYTALTSSNWASATTIVLDVKQNADDRTQYTLQTTLDANRWYWWRVRNSKQKLTIFGYVLESITSSEPKLFFTGDYKDLDSEEGENPSTPEAPSDPAPSGGGGKDGPGIGT